MAKLYQLTLFLSDDHQFQSGYAEAANGEYGTISWGEWCEKEAERINCNPNRHAEIRRAGGKLAVFVNITPLMAKTIKENNR